MITIPEACIYTTLSTSMLIFHAVLEVAHLQSINRRAGSFPSNQHLNRRQDLQLKLSSNNSTLQQTAAPSLGMSAVTPPMSEIHLNDTTYGI
jgi:hypothetical protein